MNIRMHRVRRDVASRFDSDSDRRLSNNIKTRVITDTKVDAADSATRGRALGASCRAIGVGGVLRFLRMLGDQSTRGCFIFSGFRCLTPSIRRDFYSLLGRFGCRNVGVVVMNM